MSEMEGGGASVATATATHPAVANETRERQKKGVRDLGPRILSVNTRIISQEKSGNPDYFNDHKGDEQLALANNIPQMETNADHFINDRHPDGISVRGNPLIVNSADGSSRTVQFLTGHAIENDDSGNITSNTFTCVDKDGVEFTVTSEELVRGQLLSEREAILDAEILSVEEKTGLRLYIDSLGKAGDPTPGNEVDFLPAEGTPEANSLETTIFNARSNISQKEKIEAQDASKRELAERVEAELKKVKEEIILGKDRLKGKFTQVDREKAEEKRAVAEATLIVDPDNTEAQKEKKEAEAIIDGKLTEARKKEEESSLELNKRAECRLRSATAKNVKKDSELAIFWTYQGLIDSGMDENDPLLVGIKADAANANIAILAKTQGMNPKHRTAVLEGRVETLTLSGVFDQISGAREAIGGLTFGPNYSGDPQAFIDFADEVCPPDSDERKAIMAMLKEGQDIFSILALLGVIISEFAKPFNPTAQ